VTCWAGDSPRVKAVDQPLTADPTELNLLEAPLPRNITATMHTTAIRATRSAYSTNEAPRSVLQRAWSQALATS